MSIFDKISGADMLKKPIPVIIMMLMLVAISFLLTEEGIIMGIILLSLPAIATYLFFLFKEPRIGIIILFIINYFILGVVRYVKHLPFPIGTTIDIQLFLIFISLFLKSFFHDIQWKRAWNDLFILAIIWFAWICFQLLNPMAETRLTWLASMRGVGLYMFLTIPLILIAFNKHKDLNTFFIIWGIMSILASTKGLLQKYVGLDPWEQAWINEGGSLTHILWGKLRAFSFMSDAAQFGAAQGHSGIVFLILAAKQKKSIKLRIFYAVVGLLAIYGMMISGTRGAIAVPIMGLALYTLIQRNVKVLILGAVFCLSIFIFFKFTYIGQGNYTIGRMRSAFNPTEDPSFQVRIKNQKILRNYMATRPIGAGIGSTSEKAKSITPDSLAAKIPADSWFVIIWVEQGIVGLILHLFILLYILIKSSYIIAFKIKHPWVKAQMSALVAGMFGIMVASYGNAILGQIPTCIIIYSTMAFLFLGKEYEKEETQGLAEK